MRISRDRYARLYGPTAGDRFRLADTELVCEVERDLGIPGEEAVFGGGKTIRDGMAQSQRTSAEGTPDLVITNVVVLDPILGVVKCDLGVKNGRIAALGKAGNPDVQDGVHPALVIGPGTEIIAGEHLIATAGGVDSHIHLICPQQIFEALSNGITTLIGGGTGPADGSNATTCTPGPWNIGRMLQAVDDLPVNFGLLGKGNASRPEPLIEQVLAGACGLKDHEDWGTTPSAIDCSLRVADEYDVQVAIHTDTLNESGFVEDTIAAIAGRTIHTYHSEGAGGGHAPDIIKIAAEPNVLPSSTNPTRPYTVNTLDEHLDMLMVCHHLNPAVPEDVAFAESRIRAETIAAEDVLHDLGVLSMYSSDSQAMGRIGESFAKLYQTADKMKRLGAPLVEQAAGNDNARILRYLAKLTINPARAHGVAHEVGSLEPGQAGRHRALADPVLRREAEDDREGRLDRLERDGRPERFDSDDRAGALPTDVGRLRAGHRRDQRDVHLARRGRAGHWSQARLAEAAGASGGVPLGRQAGHGPERPHAADRSRPGNLRRQGRRRDSHRAASRAPLAHPALLPGLRRRGCWFGT